MRRNFARIKNQTGRDLACFDLDTVEFFNLVLGTQTPAEKKDLVAFLRAL